MSLHKFPLFFKCCFYFFCLKPNSKQTKMSATVSITCRQRFSGYDFSSGDYHACITGHPEQWAAGKTIRAAIGDLVLHHQGIVNIPEEVLKNTRSNRYETVGEYVASLPEVTIHHTDSEFLSVK